MVYFQTLYSATTYAGYAGIATGQRPYGYTVTVDTRGHHGDYNLNTILYVIRDYWPNCSMLVTTDNIAVFVSLVHIYNHSD